MAYEVACTILGHGNDSLERKPVPKGCCIVTAVLCGEPSIVEINLKAINKLFKQNDEDTKKHIMNPRKYQKQLEKELGFEIHIAEGNKNEEANLFEFQLFLAGTNDVESTSWLTKSGLYEYPIKTKRRFIIGEELDSSNLEIEDLEMAFEESVYPTFDELKAVLPKKGKLPFKMVDELFDEHFPADSASILKRYQDKNVPVILYNFVCRSQGASIFQMELRSETKKIAGLRRKSANQNLAGRLKANVQQKVENKFTRGRAAAAAASVRRQTRKNRR
jgi:hypothetical protein